MTTETDLLREAVRLLGISIDDYDNITEGEFSGTSYYEPRMRFSQEARAFLAKIDAAEGEVPEGFTLMWREFRESGGVTRELTNVVPYKQTPKGSKP